MESRPNVVSDMLALRAIARPGLVVKYDEELAAIENGAHRESFDAYRDALIHLLDPIVDAIDPRQPFQLKNEIVLLGTHAQGVVQRILRLWAAWFRADYARTFPDIVERELNSFDSQGPLWGTPEALPAPEAVAETVAEEEEVIAAAAAAVDQTKPPLCGSRRPKAQTKSNDARNSVEDGEIVGDHWTNEPMLHPVCDVCQQPDHLHHCSNPHCNVKAHQVRFRRTL
jgi:hypothetical protein